MSAALRAYRKHEGIGQEEMGKRLGISGSHVSMLESGERNLTKDLAEKLAALIEASGMGANSSADGHTGDLVQLRQNHRENAAEALQSRIKDLEFSLHKLEKKVAAWKKAFSEARDGHHVATVHLAQGAGKMLPKTLMEKEVERNDAHQVMQDICDELPELVFSRIAGIKAEIKFAKATLKQLQKDASPEMGLPFDTGHLFSEQTDKKELPDAGDKEEITQPQS